MRYLGSKTKLLSSIEEVIMDNNLTGEVFLDLFAGTGCVGDYFKDRYKIVSNDFLFYSYILNYAKLKNSHVPEFKNFKSLNGSIVFPLSRMKRIFFMKTIPPKEGGCFLLRKMVLKLMELEKQ